MEEEDRMDFQSLTRKQLQGLCKKHGVPANLTNREMADRLSSILKESEKLTSQGESLGENSRKEGKGNGSKDKNKVVKKVRFSPENETFFYEASGYKRRGRRRCTMKSIPKKQIQPADKDVFAPSPVGRKRVKRDVKCQSVELKSAVECDVELGDGNVGGGLITRQLKNREVVVEKSHGGLVPSRKNVKGGSTKVVRNEVVEENVAAREDDKLEEMLKAGGRFTRSRAQRKGRDSDNEEYRGGCENVTRLEQTLRGVGRNVLVQKSAEAEMGSRKAEQDVANDQCSEMLSGNSRKVESVNSITRSRAKTAVEACAAESKNEEEIVQSEELSNCLSKYASRRKSVLPNKSNKRSRNSVLEGASVLEAIPDTSKDLEMVKNDSVPCGPSRRTRRNTVTFNSTVSAKVDLETQQNVGQKDACLTKNVPRRSRKNVMDSAANSAEPDEVLQQTESNVVNEQDTEILSGNPRRFKSVNQITKSRTKTVGKACAAESENDEENVLLEEHSKGPVRHTSRRKSVVSQKGKVGSDGRQQKEESRKRSRNNELERLSELEAIVEPSKELEMVKNVSVPSGPSRRTRRNTVMLKSSISAIVDEDSSLSECEPLKKRPLKRSKRITSKMDLVEPAEPTDIVVGMKQHARSKKPIAEQNALCSGKSYDFGDPKVFEHEMMEMEDNVSNLNSSEMTSPAVGFSPTNQSDDSAEPLKFVDLEKVIGAEEPSLGQNINNRSDNVDSQSNEDDRSSAQEYQNLEQVEDAKETTVEPLVQEAVLEKKSEISQVISEGKDEIDPSVVAGISYTKRFPKAIKMQEFTADFHHVTTEIGTERTAETQFGTGGGIVTETTLRKLALESEEVNEAMEQNVDQSTVLERSNINLIGQEDFSVKGTKLSNKTTSGWETSVSKAGNGIRSQVKTEDNVTADRFENDEAFYSERASQVVGEKIINEGCKGIQENFLLGSSAIIVSVKIDEKYAKKKESISERDTQDGRENESEASEQHTNDLSDEAGGKCIHELPDAATKSSELVLEKIYDGLEFVQETNCSVDITAEDVPFDEDYAASKGIDGRSLNGESDVERCADVAKQEYAESALQVDLGDKSGHEVVAPQVNGTAGTGVKEFISKESEVSDEKADGTMMKPAECVEGVDNLKVEESKFEDRNSDTEVIDVGALAEVSCTHLVENKAVEEFDGSIQYERIEADREAQTVAMKRKDFLNEAGNVDSSVPASLLIPGKIFGDKAVEEFDGSIQYERIEADREAQTVAMERKDFLNEAGNVDSSVPASLLIPGKIFGDEFAEINGRATGALNKDIATDAEEQRQRSSAVMGFMPHVDQVNFSDLDNYKKESVSDLERSASVTSDNLMASNSRAADIKEKVATVAGLNSNDVSSDAEKEDNVEAIPQVNTKDTNDHLPEAKLCNADNSDQYVLFNCASSKIGVAADDAGEVSEDGKTGSKNTGAGTKCIERTTIFSQTTKSERKWIEKNSAERRFSADTSFDEPEIDSVHDAVDMDSPFKTDVQFIKETTPMAQKVNEDLNYSITGLNVEDNAGTADKQPNDHKGAVTDTAFTDGIVCSSSINLSHSNRRKIITEVADEEIQSDKLSDMVVTENIEELHAVPSVTPRLSANCSASSPTIAHTRYESKSLELNMNSPQFTSWEMNMIFGNRDQVDVEKSAGGFSEANSITLDEDAMQVKENLHNAEQFDQQVTQIYHDEQEHHTHQAVSDEPICDNDESNQKNELSLFNKEHIDCEIQKDRSYVSPEALLLEATASSGSNISDLDGLKGEYVSDDLIEVENISLDPDGSNRSRSRGNSTDVAPTEATKATHMQVENEGTIEPVTPKELHIGCENPIETSNEITGTILQRIFSSGSGYKEKVCREIKDGEVHNEDKSNDAGRKEMDDEDIGNIYSDVALLFQEDTEAMIGKSKAADSFSLEHGARDFLEVIKDHFVKHESAANEATFKDGICCLGLNQPPCANKSKKHEVETEEANGLHCLDDKVVTAGDSKKVMVFENSNFSSTSIPEMAVDCSAISPIYLSSHSENKAIELNAESITFTSHEISLFSGPFEKDAIKNSEAGASENNLISEDARDVMIMEEVTAQVTEEQISEHKTAEEASEQVNTLATIHGISDNKNLKQEPLKCENTNSASDRNKPTCDNEELDLKNELCAFNQEHLDCEIHTDKSFVSAVLLIEPAATSGSNIADLDGIKNEFVSGDPKEAENIAVDPDVSNSSGSRGTSMNKEVHPETTKTMIMQEVENVGTIQQVTPKKLSADFENPKQTSPEISGTILQRMFSSGSGWTKSFYKKKNEGGVHNENYSKDAGRTEMADQEIGNICYDMALLFQEDTEATIGKSRAAYGFSPERNGRDSREVAKDQLDEREVETEEEDGKVVTAGDSKKAVEFENSNVASTIIPEMAVDCSAVSPLIFPSKCGPYEKDEVENSEACALETNFTSEDTRDVKDNVMITEQVSAQLTEEKIPEHKTEEDISKLDSNLCSNIDEITCKGGEASTEQENIIHGVSDNTNSATGTDTAAEDPWKLELKLLSPRRQKNPEAKTGRGNTPFAKNLNSSTRKQKNNSTLIQRTPKPKPVIHDMKENLPSTKREKIGNMTAEKTLSKRRALEDLKKK